MGFRRVLEMIFPNTSKAGEQPTFTNTIRTVHESLARMQLHTGRIEMQGMCLFRKWTDQHFTFLV